MPTDQNEQREALERIDALDRREGHLPGVAAEMGGIARAALASPTAEAEDTFDQTWARKRRLIPVSIPDVDAEPSEAEVEAAAKAMHEGGLDAMGDEAQGHLRWDDWVANSGRYFWTAEGYRGLIRTALLAARAVREDK